MNTRLMAYLRSLGLAADATNDQAWEMFQGLRGMQRTLANLLNYVEGDEQARTSSDLAIRAHGYDPATMEVVTTTDTTNGAQRQQPGTDGASANGDLERARNEGATRERARVDAIRQYATMAGTSDELVAQLEGDMNVTADMARQRIWEDHQARTRANVTQDMPGGSGLGNQAPAGHSRNSQTGYTRESLAAAMMIHHGVNDPTRSWTDFNSRTGQFRQRQIAATDTETLRAIDQGDNLRELTNVQLAARALALDGIRVDETPSDVMRGCEMLMQRTLVSTSVLLGLYTQTFGAQMLEGYNEVRDTTDWVAVRENPNFLQNERHTMGHMSGMTKHARGKTADHMDIDDSTQYAKVNRYTGQFVFDEMDLVNDSFGASSEMTPREMGASARRIRPALVYYLLLANPNLADGNAWLLANTNLFTSKALTKPNLEFARKTMMTQQARPGVVLDVVPRLGLIPPSLSATWDDLVMSAAMIAAGGGTNTLYPVGNSLSQYGYQSIVEPRLELTVTDPNTGSSATGAVDDWYMIAEGGPRPLEVTYRRGGSRSPQVRPFMLTQGQWGMGWDVKLDIGASPMNRTGIIKLEA